MIFLMLQAIEDESDRNRLSAFYLQYYGLLKAKAEFVLKQFHIGGSSNLAEDMVQDAMAKMIQNIDTISKLSDPQLVAYGVKTVQSCATDYCRKMISQQKAIEDKGILEGADEDKVWEDYTGLFTEEDPMLFLGGVLAALPPKSRDVLLYKHYFDYSDKKIAELLGIQENSVRMALSRARKKVRKTWAAVKKEKGEG